MKKEDFYIKFKRMPKKGSWLSLEHKLISRLGPPMNVRDVKSISIKPLWAGYAAFIYKPKIHYARRGLGDLVYKVSNRRNLWIRELNGIEVSRKRYKVNPWPKTPVSAVKIKFPTLASSEIISEK